VALFSGNPVVHSHLIDPSCTVIVSGMVCVVYLLVW
jgi:hypothetical protein